MFAVSENMSPEELAVLALDQIKADNEERLGKIDDYSQGNHDLPYSPRDMTVEGEELMRRSRQPWCALPARAVAQTLAVEGWRSARDTNDKLTDSPEWRMWQRSNLDARADIVHYAGATFGHAFVLSEVGHDGKAYARILSSRHTTGLYEDFLSDDNAVFAFTVIAYPGHDSRGNQVDGLAYGWTRYEKITFKVTWDKGPVVAKDPVLHGGNGHNPVTRFVAQMDSEGRVVGEVEPMFGWQDSYNQALYNLTSVQTDSAFRTIYGTGLKREFLVDDEGRPVLDSDGRPMVAPVRVAPNSILSSPDPNARFGVLPGSEQSGYVNTLKMMIQQFAGLTQTPPNFFGEMVNISAEALDAIERSFRRKVAHYQRVFGESWERVLRIGMILEGRKEMDADEHGEVVWTDFDGYQLASKADALSKMSDSLSIPPEGLWELIPGVSAGQLDEWRRLRDQQASESGLGVNLDEWASLLGESDGEGSSGEAA